MEKMGKLTDSQEKKVLEYNDTGLRYPTQILKISKRLFKIKSTPNTKASSTNGIFN